jgi:membrane protease YdiL (CAAX protease family)
MNLNLRELAFIVPVSSLSISFIVYWFVTNHPTYKKYFFTKYNFDKASLRYFLSKRSLALPLFVLVPLLACLYFLPAKPLSYYGLNFGAEVWTDSAIPVLVCSVIAVPLTLYGTTKKQDFDLYPQIQSKEWNRYTVFYTVVGWGIYLFSYEFLFRGLLFFPLVEHYGFAIATTVSVALYSLTHLPKNMKETLMAIPAGIVFCYITAETGSILPAFIVHWVIGISNCLFSMQKHPEIAFNSKRN